MKMDSVNTWKLCSLSKIVETRSTELPSEPQFTDKLIIQKSKKFCTAKKKYENDHVITSSNPSVFNWPLISIGLEFEKFSYDLMN